MLPRKRLANRRPHVKPDTGSSVAGKFVVRSSSGADTSCCQHLPAFSCCQFRSVMWLISACLTQPPAAAERAKLTFSLISEFRCFIFPNLTAKLLASTCKKTHSSPQAREPSLLLNSQEPDRPPSSSASSTWTHLGLSLGDQAETLWGETRCARHQRIASRPQLLLSTRCVEVQSGPPSLSPPCAALGGCWTETCREEGLASWLQGTPGRVLQHTQPPRGCPSASSRAVLQGSARGRLFQQALGETSKS